MEALQYTQQVVNERCGCIAGMLAVAPHHQADVLGGYPVPPGTNVLLPL